MQPPDRVRIPLHGPPGFDLGAPLPPPLDTPPAKVTIWDRLVAGLRAMFSTLVFVGIVAAIVISLYAIWNLLVAILMELSHWDHLGTPINLLIIVVVALMLLGFVIGFIGAKGKVKPHDNAGR